MVQLRKLFRDEEVEKNQLFTRFDEEESRIKSALQRRNGPRNKRDGSSEGRENVTMSLKKDNLSKQKIAKGGLDDSLDQAHQLLQGLTSEERDYILNDGYDGIAAGYTSARAH